MKATKTGFVLSLITTCVLLFGDCRKGPTEPPDPPPKNPREYVWSVDTVLYPGSLQTLMQDIWGSSPTDVYIVGHDYTAYGKMFHFDGSVWTPIRTPFGAVTLQGILGFARDNIWAVGDDNFNPLVIHFNGNSWSEVPTPSGSLLETLWGSGPSDIWFAGVNGTFFHYDGSSITTDSVQMTIPKDASPAWVFNAGSSLSPEVSYTVLVARPGGGDVFYTFKRLSGQWVPMDTSSGDAIRCLWF